MPRTTLPKVSVVMAAYNAMPFMERAINSVLSQTFSDLELIIVDDGSYDRTSDFMQNVQARDPRVRLVRNQTNMGPGFTRNNGVREARGEWIAIIDSDDHFEPNRLEILLYEAENHGAVLLADNQYMTIFDIAAHIHDQAHGSAGNIAIVVTRYGDEFDRARDAKATRQIGQKNK